MKLAGLSRPAGEVLQEGGLTGGERGNEIHLGGGGGKGLEVRHLCGGALLRPAPPHPGALHQPAYILRD